MKFLKGRSHLFVGSSTLAIGLAAGYLVGDIGGLLKNYYSSEQIEKRAASRELEESQAQAQKEKEEALLAAQIKAGEERMTPELIQDIFSRTNPESAACYPDGYKVMAQVNEEGKIVFFQEIGTFPRLDFNSNVKNNELREECLANIKLAPYWEGAHLPELSSKAHMDVIKDIYVVCATGVKESEQAVLKDGILTYTFSIAGQRSNVESVTAYQNYWKCVNSSYSSPVFSK